MGVFKTEYVKLQIIEGLYSNDPADAGGETIMGISRIAHPKWEGWRIVDAAKKTQNFPLNLKYNEGFQRMVEDLYKGLYWDTFEGDLLPQAVASELFDIAVNCGAPKAAEFLQRALNILNNNAALYNDVVVDGIVGENTRRAVLQCIKVRGAGLLAKVLNCYQAAHYIKIMENKKSQEKFIGWFGRV